MGRKQNEGESIMFSLSKEQLVELAVWDRKHECKLKENSGAIGGRLTFSFTPTGLGVIAKVKCGCGEELDLSEYEEW